MSKSDVKDVCQVPVKGEIFFLFLHKLSAMARKIRITLAALSFVGITLLFLDLTGVLHHWLGWMAKIQLFPAILSLSAVTVIIIALVTFVFGRVYCSVVCPLGIFQDIFSWIHGKSTKKGKYRFGYTKALNILRYASLAVFIAASALGVISIASLIEPYSSYGRIVNEIFAPLYRAVNNLFASVEDHFGSYNFYTSEVWFRSAASLAAAVASFVLLGFLSWKWGRIWCNSICPVGSILSLISRFSLFAPVIDKAKCRNCRLCEKRCKSSCISIADHKIDYSRCVVCLDCLEECRHDALHYRFRYSQKENTATEQGSSSREDGEGRRDFLKTGAATAGALALGSLPIRATAAESDSANRKTPLKPAGSESLKHFSDHCIACQLCVGACPNYVLTPSKDPGTLMQPEMVFTRGYCRPECTRCSNVCPAGAIRPVTKEEKTTISIGYAVVDYELCVAERGDVSCGNCARHCPAGAIRMVHRNPEDTNSARIPSVNADRCIGCGACEFNCPAKPVKAIKVEGREVHIQN